MKSGIFTFLAVFAAISFFTAEAGANIEPANRSGDKPYATEYKSRTRPRRLAPGEKSDTYLARELERSGLGEFGGNVKKGIGNFFSGIKNLPATLKEQEDKYKARKAASNVK